MSQILGIYDGSVTGHLMVDQTFTYDPFTINR